MNVLISTEKWTYQKMVNKLPAESRYEIRQNELIDMPSHKPKHQRIVFKLGELIDLFLSIKKIGELFISQLDVVFSDGDTSQPDLIFISNENKRIIKETHIKGSPDLLVEVVSKGSVARDYIEKKNDYETFGVKEYWIIDSLNESIWIYSLNENAKYDLISYAEEGESANSKLFEDFKITHSDIFEE